MFYVFLSSDELACKKANVQNNQKKILFPGNDKKDWQSKKSYPHQKMLKMWKNGVIHRVMHVIHKMKCGKDGG